MVAEKSIRSRILKVTTGLYVGIVGDFVAEKSIRSRILKGGNDWTPHEWVTYVAEKSIRSRILKAQSLLCISYHLLCCREVDPIADTERCMPDDSAWA